MGDGWAICMGPRAKKKSADHGSHHCPLGMFLCGMTQFLPPPSLPSLSLSLCWALRFSEMKESRLRVQEGHGWATGQVQFFCVDCGKGAEQDCVSLTQVHQGSLCLIPCRMRVIYPRRGLHSSLECLSPLQVKVPWRTAFPPGGQLCFPPSLGRDRL